MQRHPLEAQDMQDGRAARAAGQSATDNPFRAFARDVHHENRARFEAWRLGWESAQ